jgi:hypothetical protein
MKKHSKPQLATDNNGYVLLLSVLVVGAIGATVAVSLLVLGVISSKTTLAAQQSVQARALADTCAHEAIERLSRDDTYPAGDTITLSTGTCTVDALDGTGTTNRTVQTTGEVGTVTRRVEVTIGDLDFPMVVDSWEEVGDF